VPHFRETEAFIRAREEPAHSQSNNNDKLGLLKGAQAIADFLGEPDIRKVYYWLESGFISAFKMGGVWVSTKDRIRHQFNTTPYVPTNDNGAEPEPTSALVERRPSHSRPQPGETENPPRGRGGARRTRRDMTHDNRN
jgi:hypothetical protein